MTYWQTVLNVSWFMATLVIPILIMAVGVELYFSGNASRWFLLLVPVGLAAFVLSFAGFVGS